MVIGPGRWVTKRDRTIPGISTTHSPNMGIMCLAILEEFEGILVKTNAPWECSIEMDRFTRFMGGLDFFLESKGSIVF